MITRKRRLAIIQELVNSHSPDNQSKLLQLLHEKGFVITQTTLSRDIKQLKISKMPDERGSYKYMTPQRELSIPNPSFSRKKSAHSVNRGFISIEFSHQLGVIKTHPGYADEMSMALKAHASSIFTGIITGNDNVLLIPREGITRQEILDALTKIIPGFKEGVESE